MESVGTQERAITGVQVGSHEGLNHRSGDDRGDSGAGKRREGANVKTFGDRTYMAHWATEVGGGAVTLDSRDWSWAMRKTAGPLPEKQGREAPA